jgi:hypothetical protein
VVGRAGFGLEDAEAKSVLEVQYLEAEGEVTDLGMVKRLCLAAPVPEVVAPPHEELAERGWLDSAGNRINGPGPEWKTVEQGAATTVWAAVAPELQGVGGKYLDNCAIAEPWTGQGEVPFGCYAPYALDPDHAERLWVLSEKLTAR